MKLSDAQKADVRGAMEHYWSAYRNKDVQALLGAVSPEISGFGSGKDEVVRNIQDFTRQVERDMSQATIISFDCTDTIIHGEGETAWTTSEITFVFTADGKNHQTMKGRSTMVLRNSGDRWIIEQLHFSMPYTEQSSGQSFPDA